MELKFLFMIVYHLA